MSELSMLDRFLVENEKLMREAKKADAEAAANLAVYKKKSRAVSAKRTVAENELAVLIADFEKIEVKEIEAERLRIEPIVTGKQAVLDGKASLEDYYKKGQSDEELAAKARTGAEKKTDFLLAAVRVKSLSVLELKCAAAEIDKNVMHLSSYASSALLEKMRSQVKELERVLAPGVSSGPDWTKLNALTEELARGKGKSLSGQRWECNLEELKKLRFNPGIPDEDLPELQKIISELEASGGQGVLINYSPGGRTPKGLTVVMWR